MNILPDLSYQEKKYTHKMYNTLIKTIEDSNSLTISFKDYMNIILYCPNLGYYTSSYKNKFGIMGDFITAPIISKLFSQTFAIQFRDIINDIGDETVIIEFGAGNGNFAFNCLKKLNELNYLPKNYFIIEISPFLIKEQKKILNKLHHSIYKKIIWLSKLPKNKKFSAIIFANEFLDSIPIELFRFYNHSYKQMMVTYNNNNLILCENNNIDELLLQRLNKLPIKNNDNQHIYQSEINLFIEEWLSLIKDIMNDGVIFICDYGYHRSLYYSKERYLGTLQCYYKHYVHNNPMIYQGIQDVSAHIDFTSIAEIAQQLKLDIDGFAIQRLFLQNAGILECYQYELNSKKLNTLEKIKLKQELKNLILGQNFTDNFKVMSLSYNYHKIIDVFEDIDLSYLL